MESVGLISESFEESIHSFTLKFKDRELEEAYIEAQTSLKFLTTTTKRFLIYVLIGELATRLLDVISAVGINPDYYYTLEDWIIYCLVPLFIVLELIFYFCTSLASCRGLGITIIEAFMIFFNSYNGYLDYLFYPYTCTM